MNLTDLKPPFLSLPPGEQLALLERIRESRFVLKTKPRRASTKKKTKSKKELDLSSLSVGELESLIAQLTKESEELSERAEGEVPEEGSGLLKGGKPHSKKKAH